MRACVRLLFPSMPPAFLACPALDHWRAIGSFRSLQGVWLRRVSHAWSQVLASLYTLFFLLQFTVFAIMKFVESKIKGLLRRKSKKSRSIGEGGSGEGSNSSSSGSLHSLSSSSKSPVETPKSVLSYSAASSSCAVKVSVPQPNNSEILVCGEDKKGKQILGTSNDGFVLPTATGNGNGKGFMLPTATSGVDELREVFKVFDADGDGKITKSELGCVLRSLGDDLSEEDLVLMVQAADKDGDGCIDLQEFISLNTVDAADADATAIVASEGILPAMDDLRDAFRIFDADMDGKISAQELHRVLTSLGDAECTIDDCRQMIRGVDKDGDGFVDFQDFRRMMTTMC